MSTMKQLKKNDFLTTVICLAAAAPNTPITRGQVVDALADYQFIPTYLDYLTDHFAAQGKLIKDEDGTFTVKAKGAGGSSNPRTKFRVLINEETGEYELESAPVEKGDHITKDCGWYNTANRAIKVATSEVFATYIATTKAIKALAPEVEAKAE